MNVSENWGEENTDVLLFEYLEGELSADKVLEFEQRLASDPALQMELEQWNGAFVTQDFYDTKHLEESLLQHKVEVGNGINSVVVISILTILFSFLSLPLEKVKLMPFQPMSLPSPIIVESKEARNEEISKSALPAKALYPVALPAKTMEEPIPAVPQSEKVAELEVIQPKKLVPSVTPSISTPDELEMKMNVVTIPKALAKQIITRKQQRKTERMKEKARQEREANQFLKGRVPYVVPLNTNNF